MVKDFQHKKKYGQNFLKDLNIVRKIVRQADIVIGENIWEIGPGHGALTDELLQNDVTLTVFEIDKSLYPYLENRYSEKINLIKKDILKVNWESIVKKNTKVVANLPYQITSPFLFKAAEFSDYFSAIILMIQKEVALRINAKPGSKNYGILSLKMQYYFETKYLFKVEPHLFKPQPKVDSAVIKLLPRKNKPKIENLKLFWTIIETAFRKRRKMLRKNLQEILSKDEVNQLQNLCSIDLKRRGETLSEEDFIILYNSISNNFIINR